MNTRVHSRVTLTIGLHPSMDVHGATTQMNRKDVSHILDTGLPGHHSTPALHARHSTHATHPTPSHHSAHPQLLACIPAWAYTKGVICKNGVNAWDVRIVRTSPPYTHVPGHWFCNSWLLVREHRDTCVMPPQGTIWLHSTRLLEAMGGVGAQVIVAVLPWCMKHVDKHLCLAEWVSSETCDCVPDTCGCPGP
jgi:hypothetical protein